MRIPAAVGCVTGDAGDPAEPVSFARWTTSQTLDVHQTSTKCGTAAGRLGHRQTERLPPEDRLRGDVSGPQRELVCIRTPSSMSWGQLTALFTSAPIFASSAAVNSFSAKAVGHMAPASRCALSLKPIVAYLVLNFCALWKKQTTLPSLAYAGIPYQVLGERSGALALTMAWSRLPSVAGSASIRDPLLAPSSAPGRLTTRVVRVPVRASDASTLGGPPASTAALRELTSSRFLDEAADALAEEPLDVLGYASTSSAYAIGFDAETAMLSRLAARLRLPTVGTCASAVLAFETLGIERIALVHPPWFDDELNLLGAAFFESRGLRVVSAASAELSQDPAEIEPHGVVEWTRTRVGDNADGIFIGGNGFRAARAIEPLEAALGRPVLESNQVLLWNPLGRARATFSVRHFGRVFAEATPAADS
jgi:maleate isomerase